MDLTKINSKQEVKEYLKNFKPQTESEAIKALVLISLIKSAEKDVKKSCYAFLEELGMDKYIDPETGLGAEKITPNRKVHNKTKRIEEIEAEIKKLKGELEIEKARAGYETVESKPYFKTF